MNLNELQNEDSKGIPKGINCVSLYSGRSPAVSRAVLGNVAVLPELSYFVLLPQKNNKEIDCPAGQSSSLIKFRE